MGHDGQVGVGEAEAGAKTKTKAKGWIGADEHLGQTRPPPRPPAAHWPAARIAAVEALWGRGFVMPGGAPETLRLARPLGLSPAATLMLLGGGVGGPAQALCGESGAWIASFEADAELCTVALARRGENAHEDRITVTAWDPASPDFGAGIAHHALSLEALRGTNLQPLFDGMAAALRPRGQIVLTELVAEAAPNDSDREFAAWCRLDNRLPHLPKPADITSALQRLRFDVRAMQDMSDRHISQTLGGWRDAVRGMQAGPRPTPHSAAAFVTEAELWLLRIRLMRRLGVRLVMWHAIGSA